MSRQDHICTFIIVMGAFSALCWGFMGDRSIVWLKTKLFQQNDIDIGIWIFHYLYRLNIVLCLHLTILTKVAAETGKTAVY